MEPTADHVSLAAGLDAPGAVGVAHDVDHPHGDIHLSHDLVNYDRWGECKVCGVRDYWAAALAPCAGIAHLDKRGRKIPPHPVTLSEALERLRADLEQFAAWWEQKNLGDERPDHAEWCAEFLAWTHDRGGEL